MIFPEQEQKTRLKKHILQCGTTTDKSRQCLVSICDITGQNAGKTEAYYNNPDFTVLCNDLRVQAVRENKLGVTGAIFWEPIRTSLDFMTVSSCAAVAMVKQADGEVTVSVSDQTQKNTEGIDIELRLPVDTVVKSNPNVTVTKTDYGVLLHVDTKDSHGKSFSVTLS